MLMGECTVKGLSALGNNYRFKDINLSECVTISDLGLQKFAQQCKEIERLNLSHCQVRDIATCVQLTVLGLPLWLSRYSHFPL